MTPQRDSKDVIPLPLSSTASSNLANHPPDTQVRFGVQFRNFPSQHKEDIVNRMLEVAVKCEKLGFDSIWMIDHLEMCPPISFESQPLPDCWAILSALAGVTENINVGSLVTCVLFRNPHYLSKVCRTVNEISDDRLIVGVGSGWFDQEFRAYGIDYPGVPRDRLARTSEAVRILQADGPRYPIWIGGSGEDLTLKLVAKFADGCSLFGDPETVSRKLKSLQRYCDTTGRDSTRLVKSKQSNAIIGDCDSEVEAKMKGIISDESKWNAFAQSNIVGTPEKCLEQVMRYVNSGINYFTLNFPDVFDLDCLDIFSNSVIGMMKRGPTFHSSN